MSYQLLKSLHLLGVTLFLGNIIVTAVWKSLADRTKTPVVVAYAQCLVSVTDIAFTAVGAVLIAATGMLMVGGHAAVFSTTWLTWGYGLFIASGVLWLLVLIPIQIKQARLAKSFQYESEVPMQYWRLARAWAVFGTIATLLPLANLYFMVFKPA